MGVGKMSEVRVLEIILPLLPQHASRKVIEYMCEIGHASSVSVWFVYEGRYYMVQRAREGWYWFDACTLPAPAGAAAYGLTLWELSK